MTTVLSNLIESFGSKYRIIAAYFITVPEHITDLPSLDYILMGSFGLLSKAIEIWELNSLLRAERVMICHIFLFTLNSKLCS